MLSERVESPAENATRNDRLHDQFDGLSFVEHDDRVAGLRLYRLGQIVIDGQFVAGEDNRAALVIFQAAQPGGVGCLEGDNSGGRFVQPRALILHGQPFGKERDECLYVRVVRKLALPLFHRGNRNHLVVLRFCFLFRVPHDQFVGFAQDVVHLGGHATGERIAGPERSGHDQRGEHQTDHDEGSLGLSSRDVAKPHLEHDGVPEGDIPNKEQYRDRCRQATRGDVGHREAEEFVHGWA